MQGWFEIIGDQIEMNIQKLRKHQNSSLGRKDL